MVCTALTYITSIYMQKIGAIIPIIYRTKYIEGDESDFYGILSKISIMICEKAIMYMWLNMERKIPQ